MIILKSKMTPAELADLTGYTPQTLNKWARKYHWTTSLLPGVKGGKARVIHIDEQVREFLFNTGLVRQQESSSMGEAREMSAAYSGPLTELERQLLDSARQMTPDECTQLSALLLREGISGMLKRLGINNSQES